MALAWGFEKKSIFDNVDRGSIATIFDKSLVCPSDGNNLTTEFSGNENESVIVQVGVKEFFSENGPTCS
jgi:hypothetical protein